MSTKKMAAARQVKKTEAGTEYQTEVLTKEVKRLKKVLTRQIGSFETLIQEADGKRVKQELEKLHLIFAELFSVSDRLQPLLPKEEADRIAKETATEGTNVEKLEKAVKEWLEAQMNINTDGGGVLECFEEDKKSMRSQVSVKSRRLLQSELNEKEKLRNESQVQSVKTRGAWGEDRSLRSEPLNRVRHHMDEVAEPEGKDDFNMNLTLRLMRKHSHLERQISLVSDLLEAGDRPSRKEVDLLQELHKEILSIVVKLQIGLSKEEREKIAAIVETAEVRVNEIMKIVEECFEEDKESMKSQVSVKSRRLLQSELNEKEKLRNEFQVQSVKTRGAWGEDRSLRSEPLKRVRHHMDEVGERWEKGSGVSVRSTKSEVLIREKAYARRKNEVLIFEDGLLSQLRGVRRKINQEICHTRHLIEQGRDDMLCDKIGLLGKLQKDRETPVVQLYKFLAEKQATDLAASVAAEDTEIRETIERAVEAREIERLERRSQRSVMSKSSRRSGISRRSERDCISVNSGISVAGVEKSWYAEEQVGVNDRKGHISQREALKETFTRRRRELKNQKGVCKELIRSRCQITSGKDIKKLEDSYNTMVDVGYRLREQLPSMEAEEIDLELNIEDNEVFEVKKEMIKLMTGGKDDRKATRIQVRDSNKEKSKVLDVVRDATEKDKLKNEMTVVKTRLENQKELMKDILMTQDKEMIRRELQTLDKVYDDYVAVVLQARDAAQGEEAERLSEIIAAEDCSVFRQKKAASKALSKDWEEKEGKGKKILTSEVEDDVEAIREDSEMKVPADKEVVIREEKVNKDIQSENLVKVTELMVQTLKLTTAPDVDIDTYSGDPLEFIYFIENFKDVVENVVDSPKQRLVRLLKYTEGEAKELIKHCIHEEPEFCYAKALSLLEKEFGDPSRIACAYMEKLKSWPQIKANDANGLKSLYRFLLRSSSYQKKCSIDLNSPLTIRSLQLALPINLQDNWVSRVCKIRARKKVEATFDDFVIFIDEWCRAWSDPVYARGGIKERSEKHKVFATEFQEQKKEGEPQDGKTLIKCPLCRMQHDLDDCPNFKEKSARDKKDFLFKAKICFCCYGKDHLAEKCNSKRTCNECGESHPTGLHGVSFKVSAIHQDEGGAMCVVPVRLRHRTWKDREIETYALLDECSTGTFISESLSEVLEDTLKEKRTVMVHTVNRSDESEAFKVKDLIVRGSEEFGALYDLEDIDLPATFSQESIPMEREDIQLPETVRKWEYLEKVASTLTGIKDIPMGLLIGTNCPKALEPMEVIPSQNNGPYATRRRLGWCVSAPVEERPGIVKCNRIRVCHTRITDISINKALQQMWENDFIEKSSERKTFSREDRTFLDQMKREISFSEGHYVLPLPLRMESKIVPKGDASQREEISLPKHESDHSSEEKAGRVERRSEPGEKGNNKKKVKIVSPENLTKSLKEAERDTDIVAMPNNKANVLHRLKWVKKRMMKDEGFCKEYCEFMKKLFKAGHARKVPRERLLERSWYIPHHGVYHPSKKKLRVVFDCSAELDGVSLNSMLLQGPDFMNSMLGVLVRFRIGLIPVMADIEAMYHQVKIPEEHCKFLRFFWWEDGFLSREPVECEMCVHPFGAISSKNCVIFALHQTAYDNQNTFGNAAMKTLLQDFYVDDMLKADDDKDEIIRLLRNIIGMCGEGGFNITKFVTPDSDVLNTIPEGKRSGDHGTHKAGSLMPAESALGVLWNLRDDTFGFYVSFSTDDGTRAGCLSTISKIHDPNGMAAPFILPGRKILQKMTAGSGSWSDKLSPDEAKDWERWKEDVLLLNQLKMRRCYKSPSFGRVVQYSLHCFSDASFVGYGVACYLRMVNAEGEVELSLVMGKARVSPLKPTTVPRLELTAATVSVKIAAMLIDELKLSELKVYYWVDSKIVLGYILNGRRRYRIYVANRKELINTYTEEDQWRHIDTEDNPSDFASRGMSPRDSEKVERWLGGPLFLRQRDDAWKHLCPQVEIKEDDAEVKAKMRVNAASLRVSSVLDTLEKRISSWHKMKRVMVWVFRFLSKKWRAKKRVEIKVAEIQQAENAIIKLMQERSYKKEIMALRNLGRKKREKEPRKVNKNKKSVKGDRKVDESKKVVKGLRKLDPFIDEDGIMRVGGRLAHADEDESFKSPVLIPKNSKATRALIRWHHGKTEHRGKHTTIGRLREVGFWIVNGSREVGSVVFKCVRCRWLRGKLNGQKMADLPWNRTTVAPPFTYCGVDVFGPVYVKEGRKVLKRYGSLFTCFSLRAVHIEMLASLETDSFIQALCRFISRRGAVREIRSDNGTNFVGAERELREAMQEMDQAKIGKFLTEQGCDYILWERNAPKASHMGGVWERQIRTVKSVMSSLVKSSPKRLDEESMRTFFTEAEAIVNSRPLTLESLHDPEMRPLTPNQILTMKTKVASPPPGVFQNEGVYSRKRWRVVQHLADAFWSRWRREYLQLLQTRTKWTEERRNLQVNDVVLMKDEDVPRGRWPMARVTETHPSKDGLVRSVTLSAKGSLFKRPVHKTVLLVAGDDDQEDAHSQ